MSLAFASSGAAPLSAASFISRDSPAAAAAIMRDVELSGSKRGTSRKEAALNRNHIPNRQGIVIGMTGVDWFNKGHASAHRSTIPTPVGRSERLLETDTYAIGKSNIEQNTQMCHAADYQSV